jgi:hypothetical protein
MRPAAAALLLAAGLAVAAPPPVDPPPPPADHQVAETLFLIGDAGEPAHGGEPVLIALRRQLEGTGGRAAVAFLGDNVYPAGLPAPGHPHRAEMERRIDDQVDAVRGLAAQTVFIPGNHDWEKGGEGGWEAVRRQERRIEERGGPSVVHLPNDGCPGPEVVDLSGSLRLVALDTQWWLHDHARPLHPDSACPADSEEEVLAALREALASAGERSTVVLAHHPLVSGGPHGGRFGFKQHLFPLTDVKGKLWIPLPVIGSLYPLARSAGVSPQDQGHGRYERMREALVEAAREHPPLAWASGHEHVLQVIESPRWGRVLVSGAGIWGHLTHVYDVPGSLYRAARSGFMRLDVLRDGTRRLGVVEVERDGTYREAFARRLE